MTVDTCTGQIRFLKVYLSAFKFARGCVGEIAYVCRHEILIEI